jgi:D-sedoheptulose 7-phosphate isomerase
LRIITPHLTAADPALECLPLLQECAMEYETLVEQMFHHSINAKIDCVDAVTAPLVRAGMVLAECLLDERKILVCGNGCSALNAQFFVTTLMNQGERERPALPAILLDNSSAMQAAIESDYSLHDALARQIRALGQPGDVLVIFTRTGIPANQLNAVTAAHERDMMVVAITAQDGGHLPSLLSERDVEIRVPQVARFRIYENHLLLSFALCELIEFQLFGGT